MTCNHWTDEEMIDFTMGKLPDQKSNKIMKSIIDCNHCHEQYLSWNNIIPTSEELTAPEQAVDKRIFHSFSKIHKKEFKPLLSPNLWKYASVAIVFIAFLFVGHYWKPTPYPSEKNAIMTMNEDTEFYELEPDHRLNTEGYVLVNKGTNEFYLFVDGLSPIHNKDYQAWVKNYEGLHDAGVVQLLDGSGQIYLQRKPLPELEYIILSIEPKGGSHTPSEQETFMIRLNAK